MMSILFSGLVAALTASTAVVAQYTQTGPFALKIRSSTNETLDGTYLSACHAGAAIEGFCLGGKTAPNATENYSLYYYNTTTYNNVSSETGTLIWKLTAAGGGGAPLEVDEPMALQFSAGSNEAVPMFTPGTTTTSVGFNGTEVYIPAYYDDSTFQPYAFPVSNGTRQLTNWYACWTIVGGYYYQAAVWVTAGAPTNPTCQKICIEKEEV